MGVLIAPLRWPPAHTLPASASPPPARSAAGESGSCSPPFALPAGSPDDAAETSAHCVSAALCRASRSARGPCGFLLPLQFPVPTLPGRHTATALNTGCLAIPRTRPAPLFAARHPQTGTAAAPTPPL